jgi:hypothetical protein
VQRHVAGTGTGSRYGGMQQAWGQAAGVSAGGRHGDRWQVQRQAGRCRAVAVAVKAWLPIAAATVAVLVLPLSNYDVSTTATIKAQSKVQKDNLKITYQ